MYLAKECNEPQLITFGDLLKIKREALGLNQTEAQKRIGIGGGNLTVYENKRSFPSKEHLAKIISFYKITEEELKACRFEIIKKGKILNLRNKFSAPEGLPIQQPKKKTVVDLILDLKFILEEIEKMDETGIFAKKLKTDLKENLRQAHELLNDVLIIDRLI